MPILLILCIIIFLFFYFERDCLRLKLDNYSHFKQGCKLQPSERIMSLIANLFTALVSKMFQRFTTGKYVTVFVVLTTIKSIKLVYITVYIIRCVTLRIH